MMETNNYVPLTVSDTKQISGVIEFLIMNTIFLIQGSLVEKVVHTDCAEFLIPFMIS